MAHQHRPYPLRMPDEMREYLQMEADKNNRSLHAEIVMRLQQSLPDDLDIPKERFARPSSSRNSSIKKKIFSTKETIIGRPQQWQLDDLERFEESINYMMKMLDVMKEGSSEQISGEPHETKDNISEETKNKKDYGKFR